MIIIIIIIIITIIIIIIIIISVSEHYRTKCWRTSLQHVITDVDEEQRDDVGGDVQRKLPGAAGQRWPLLHRRRWR